MDNLLCKMCQILAKIIIYGRKYSPNLTHVKKILYTYDFGIVFHNQGVGYPHLFIELLKQRLSFCALQEWSGDINESPKLRSCCEYKSLLVPEKYLDCINKKAQSCTV